jgi:hypothetical protein
LGFQTQIPPEVLSDNQSILTPLTDGEQEEEREVTMYTVLFVADLDKEEGMPTKTNIDQEKTTGKTSKGKKAIDPNTVPEDVDIIWRETFNSNMTLDFNDPMIREKLVVFTNKITERAHQTEKDQATTQNILKVEHWDAIQRGYGDSQCEAC